METKRLCRVFGEYSSSVFLLSLFLSPLGRNGPTANAIKIQGTLRTRDGGEDRVDGTANKVERNRRGPDTAPMNHTREP